MKTKNRVLTSSLCILLALNLFAMPALAVSADNTTGGELLAEIYYAQISEVEEELVAAQEKEYALNEIYSEIEESMQVNIKSTAGTSYVPGYAGSYIDNNRNTLVVCVTTDEMIPDSKEPSVTYKLVKYSYNELADVKSSISSKYEEYYALYGDATTDEAILLESFVGIGVDEEYNKLIIDILDLSDKKIDTFVSLFGENDMYVFQEAGGFVEDIATYKPGVALYVITGKSGSTYNGLRKLDKKQHKDNEPDIIKEKKR